jgi:hypothetical protein
MESFKFFSKNNIRKHINFTSEPEPTYNDLERGWCETIFYMISNVDNIIEGRKYRIHHLNDELRFVVTNNGTILNPVNFDPIKRIRVLFSVNDINIYTLFISATLDLTEMSDFDVHLSNGNEITEFNRCGGF